MYKTFIHVLLFAMLVLTAIITSFACTTSNTPHIVSPHFLQLLTFSTDSSLCCSFLSLLPYAHTHPTHHFPAFIHLPSLTDCHLYHFSKNSVFFAPVLRGKNDLAVKTLSWYCRVQIVFAGLLPS